MDLLDLVPYAGGGRRKPQTRSEEAASAFASALLPMGQVCLFVWLGSEGINPFVLLLALPPLSAGLAFLICRALKVPAELTTRSTLACLVFSLIWDFPALFLVAVTQTF